MKNTKEPTAKAVLTVGMKRLIVSLLALIIIPLVINRSFNASANTTTSGSQVKVQIDLLEETAIVTAGPGGSTKFYISTDNMKTWEYIDYASAIDLSGIMSSKPVTVYFKGNKDTNPLKVDLPGEDNSLKVKYEVVDGVGRIVFSNSSLPVEYRKGSNGVWKSASNNMPTIQYELKGASLQFRTVATASRRAGKIVTVKIPKRPAAPSVSLDASKLVIKGLKAGQTQYRVGDATNWTTFSPPDGKSNSIDISALLPSSNNLIPAGTIEFRTLGSNKKVHSAIKVIEILPQAAAPSNVNLVGKILTISDSDTKRNYEYAVVPLGTAIDMKKLKWKTVTSKSPVTIKRDKGDVLIGDKVLVRIKSTTDKNTKQLILPSAYIELTVTSLTPAQ